ncbi:hypothetical protein GGR21_003351 [Dysgonomonas hofstadii]|uniref:Uncharacterized protein n=1 Tax=Dysgonomonas hofstadii TaxID=637886 RepID=A0A840CUS5_9BACT|nr:hypothetical protein [Dysgonomonas hofstadii]MBB4037434.1 hypothetical protein [Dysgonomonas hofstadii]
MKLYKSFRLANLLRMKNINLFPAIQPEGHSQQIFMKQQKIWFWSADIWGTQMSNKRNGIYVRPAIITSLQKHI